MKNSFSYLGNISDEDRILLSNVVSWANIANEKRFDKYSFFLDERQQKLCEKVLAGEKIHNFCFWGGYENASRKILGLMSDTDQIYHESFPLRSICFTYRTVDKLTHRDFLGALLSMQIERKCIGDIIVGEGKTNVLVYETIAERVLYEITRVGRTGVKAAVDFDDTIPVGSNMVEISGTVSSLRADCLFSMASKLSREKAASKIRMNGINIDHMPTYKIDETIKQGQSFSVKGYGKFILKSINGVSKKDRIHVTLCKYI